MKTPFLSIVIPAYNLGDWLDSCIQSIIAQTQKEGWEILVIDDGSRDDTGIRADTWAKHDVRIAAYHFENGGENIARLRGLSVAKGDYVWFVDGDDQLHPQAVEIFFAQEKSIPDADVWFVDETSGIDLTFEPLCREIKKKVFGPNEHFLLPLETVHLAIYRRSFIVGQEFENLLIGADLLFMQKQLVRASKIVHLRENLYGYQLRATSISHTPSLRRVQQNIEFLRRFLRFYSQAGEVLSKQQKVRLENDLLFNIPGEMARYKGDDFKKLLHEWLSVLEELKSYQFDSSYFKKIYWALVNLFCFINVKSIIYF